MYQRILTIDDVIDAYNQNHRVGDKKRIIKAYEFAAEKHGSTTRGSGELYINHLLRVARFVATWGLESDVVAAALLHDVVEDCQVELSELARRFGSGTAQIVDTVTALSDRDFAGRKPSKEKKDLLSDVRLQQKMNEKALYVKIADRIDNLSTIDGVPEEKRVPKAEHTRRIIIPMAKLQHAYAHVDTLEELCFQIEHPQMYQMIVDRMGEIRAGNNETCAKTIQKFKNTFTFSGDQTCVELEPYRPYLRGFLYRERPVVSIYRRLSHDADNLKKDWRQLLTKERMAFYDLTLIISDAALREKKDMTPSTLFFTAFMKCLSAEGLYLLRPETTSYGNMVYFMLSDEMDNLYRLFIMTETDYMRYLYGDIIDSKGDFCIHDVDELDPSDTYNDRIKVFDKDSCAVKIYKDATVLDFAFYIHTELGLHFDYALINDSKIHRPPHTRLAEGQTVTIVTNEHVVPSITWFNYIRTRRAVHHLVNYFRDEYKLE